MTSQEIVMLLEKHGELIMNKIIADVIKDNETELSKLKTSYGRYSGDKPIKHRKKIDPSDNAINSKLSNDFEGDIVDEIKGFVFGENIKTSYPDEAGNSKIQEFMLVNAVDALDTELAEYMLASGRGARLLYFDKLGRGRAMNLKPWQTIFIQNSSTDEIDYALIYYPYEPIDIESGKKQKTIRVEWYDKTNVTYYVKQGGRFTLEKGSIFEEGNIIEMQNPQPHMFDYVPVLKFAPNPREQSAFYKSESLIDGYDETISTMLDEVLELRNAYLKAVGGTIDETERIKARKTRVFNLPDKDSDVDFITKNINPDYVDTLLKTLSSNIYKYSKTVDMANEKFNGGSAESGEARKWKLLSLVFEGIVIERYFTKSLREQYTVLASAWNKSVIKIDPLKIKFEFTRSLPKDLLYISSVVEGFWGKIPTETVYNLIPFIDDVQKALEAYKEEFGVDLDNINIPADQNAN